MYIHTNTYRSAGDVFNFFTQYVKGQRKTFSQYALFLFFFLKGQICLFLIMCKKYETWLSSNNFLISLIKTRNSVGQ